MAESQESSTTKTAFISPLDRLNSLVYLHWTLVLHVHDLDKAVRDLTKGLSRLTAAVPYLKGRVSYPADANDASPTTRLIISWGPNDEELEFREHTMAKKPPSLETMKREHAPAHFFPTDIISLPLFVDVSSRLPQCVFEATYIPIEGGLVINMCVHHGVMDGRGLATLTEMWAEYTRLETLNDELGTAPLKIERKLPDPDEPLTRTARLVAAGTGTGPSEHRPLKELVRRYENDHAFGQNLMALLSMTASGPKCASRIVSFSGNRIEKAKMALARGGSVARNKLTVNSVLNAVIWSCITRIRLSRREQRPPTSVSRFSLAVDGRRRLGPAIDEPGPYLGNVVLISSVDLSLDVLAAACTNQDDCALAIVIETVAHSAARITTDHISGLLSALQQVQDSSDVGPGWLSPHRVNFMASSWANLPLYECDFGPALSKNGTGSGAPVFVRYPYAEYNDGNVVVLPRRRMPPGVDEAIEVYVMLAEDDLQALMVDEIFRGWLSSAS